MNTLIAKINNTILTRFQNNGFEPLTLEMKKHPPETIQIIPIFENETKHHTLKDIKNFKVIIYPNSPNICKTLPEVAELIMNAPTIYQEKEEEKYELYDFWFRLLQGKNIQTLNLGLELNKKYNDTTTDRELQDACINRGISYYEYAEARSLAKNWIRFQEKYKTFYGITPDYQLLQKILNKNN